MNVDDLLRVAMGRRASDLHLKVGNYPHLRIDGELIPLTDPLRISAEDMAQEQPGTFDVEGSERRDMTALHHACRRMSADLVPHGEQGHQQHADLLL